MTPYTMMSFGTDTGWRQKPGKRMTSSVSKKKVQNQNRVAKGRNLFTDCYFLCCNPKSTVSTKEAFITMLLESDIFKVHLSSWLCKNDTFRLKNHVLCKSWELIFSDKNKCSVLSTYFEDKGKRESFVLPVWTSNSSDVVACITQ